MKFTHTFAAVAAASMIALCGCKSVPTPAAMKATATAVGVAAGLVANETKIDDKARAAVIAVVGEAAKVTPATGQSFEDAWTPVAQAVIDQFVAEGKIDETAGQIAMAAFAIAVKGVDYIFDIRYPKARAYEELVAAAVSGFTEGFLTTFKPANAEKSLAAPAPDAEALAWLKEKAAK